MATKQIGKLKLHWSKQGVAYKWGDGDIHRLAFGGKKTNDTQDDAQAYQEDYGQHGGYTDSASYSNTDGYQPYDGYTDAGAYDEAGVQGKYGALYQNDWLMYLLLVVLPPLGIWILWKRERFTQPIRLGISVLSGVWFILLLVWLFSAMFGGGTDQIQQGAVSPVLQATPLPQDVTATVAPADGDRDLTIPVDPAATPRASTGDGTASGSGSGTTDTTGDTSGTDATDTTDTTESPSSGYVYASSTGSYYHNNSACPDIEANASRVELTLARSRGQTSCPTCYGTEATSGSTYYATTSGKYYHVDATCSKMKNARTITLSEAKRVGKSACPVCIGNYYMTDTGKYYHVKSSCSGMRGATRTTKANAVAKGKKPCPVCIKAAVAKKASSTKKTTTSSAAKYYATKSGKYYHVKSNCGGMKGASRITLTTAKKYGKTACPVCIAKSTASAYYATQTGAHYHKSKSCPTLKNIKSSLIKKITLATAKKYNKTPCKTCLASAAQATSRVYATTGGKYYHKTSTCSGMKNAKALTLAVAKSRGKTACPTCYKSTPSLLTYYSTTSNRYYHKTKTCSGMLNARKITLAQAKKLNKTACPVCLKSTKKTTTTYCYAAASNKYYHTKANCSGMIGASRVTLAYAKSKGKTACPVCVKKTAKPTTAAKVYCYASSGSKYYHKNKNCSGMLNAKKVLLSVAKAKGKTACPVCVKKTTPPKTVTKKTFADKNTVCYASNNSAYYHSNKDCVSGLKKTNVYTAKSKGKTACPMCARSIATYVYVTRNGVRYHRTATCGGVKNTYKVSLKMALAKNYTRCPKCNAPKG